MSQTIAIPGNCDGECTAPSNVGPPGATGATGAAGTNGTDGVSAFTTVADYSPGAQPVMPAEGASVTINTTSDTGFLTPGEPVYINGWGTLLVTNVPTSSSVTVQNLEDSGTGEYADNAAPGTSLAAGSKIVPSGFQGVGGTPAAGALLAVNNLNDVSNVATSRTNLGLGTAATRNDAFFIQTTEKGTGNNKVPTVNDASGLTSGEVLFATASGIESKDVPSALTALDLSDSISGTGQWEEVANNNTSPGSFTSGSWVTRNITNQGYNNISGASIAANKVTLPAGTYRIRAVATGYKIDRHCIRIWDVTNGTQLGSIGIPAHAPAASDVETTAQCYVYVTFAAPTEIRLEHICETTNGTDGLGKAQNWGITVNVFSYIYAEKVAGT